VVKSFEALEFQWPLDGSEDNLLKEGEAGAEAAHEIGRQVNQMSSKLSESAVALSI